MPGTAGRRARTPPGVLALVATGDLRRAAGVVRQDLSEVVGAVDRGEPGSGVVQEQQRPVLGRRAATERVGGPGDVGSAELPEAADAVIAPRGEERVEPRARRWVGASGPGRAVADAARVGRLDPWQVRFEPDAVVVPSSVEGGAREQDRSRVPSSVLPGVLQGSRPGLLVRDAVEVIVRADAAPDQDPQ